MQNSCCCYSGGVVIRILCLKINGGFEGDQSTCLNKNIYREHGELYSRTYLVIS